MSKTEEKKEVKRDDLKISSLNVNQIKDILEGSGYGEPLKEQLAKFGVGQAWKPGRKKADIIKEALEKISMVKSLIDKGMTQSEIDEHFYKKDELKKEELKKELVKKSIEEAKLLKEKEKQEAQKDYSKEDLEKRIKNIEGNLKGATEHQRVLLFEKKAIFEKLLKRKNA